MDELRRLQAREQGAQHAFWEEHWTTVFTCCVAILKSSMDAAEVAEDVLSDFLFDKVDGLRSLQASRAFLRLMAVHAALRHQARLRRWTSAMDPDGLPDGRQEDPETQLVTLEEARGRQHRCALLEACLRLLSEDEQRILRLRFYEGRTYDEIGRQPWGGREQAEELAAVGSHDGLRQKGYGRIRRILGKLRSLMQTERRS